MKKKVISISVRIIVSLGLLTYFVLTTAGAHGGLRGAARQFIGVFSSASLHWLLPAALFHFAGISLTSWRWRVLLAAQGVHRPFRELFSYYFMAAFFNTFLPSTVGGDAIRAVESSKHTENPAASIMVVIIERITGVAALLIISIAGLSILSFRAGDSPLKSWKLAGGGVLFLILLVILAHPRIAPKILHVLGRLLPARLHRFFTEAYAAVAVFYKNPRSLLTAQFISIVFQLIVVLYYYFITRGLNQAPDPVDFLIRMPVIIFLLMTVPAINGIGVRTAGFKQLFVFPPAIALAAETADLAFRTFYGLLGGLFYLFYKRPQTGRPQVNQP